MQCSELSFSEDPSKMNGTQRSMHPLCTHSLVLLADQINGWEQDVATTLLDLLTLFKVVFRQWCMCELYIMFSAFFTASSGFV